MPDSRPTQAQDLVSNLMPHSRKLAEVAKALSDENRMRILLTVARGRKSVSRVVEEVALSQPLVSHHLRELRRADLVSVEREGPFIYYEIAEPRVLAALSLLREVGNNRVGPAGGSKG